ncbi:hypothetical protein ScPMuIL_000515 [Solemya velum]
MFIVNVKRRNKRTRDLCRKYNMTAEQEKGETELEKPKISRIFLLKVVACASTIIAVVLLVIVIVLAHYAFLLPYCKQGNHIIPRNLENPGIFDDLSAKEFRIVRNYLMRQTELKLTWFDHALPNTSYIYMIDLHMPLKSAAKKYVDRGGKKPERAAKAVVFRGDLVPARVEEYLVGPLPWPTYHIQIKNPSYTKFRIPFSSRPVDNVEYKILFSMLNETSVNLYPLLIESYGVCYHNCTKGRNCIVFSDVGPRGRTSGERLTWFWAFRDVEGYYIHPVGLEIQIDHSSADSSQWKIIRIFYNGQMFYHPDDLMSRYKQNRVRKVKLPNAGFKEDLYSSYNRRGPVDIDPPMQGPSFIEPDGRRYIVDGQHIRYMNWDFNVRVRTMTGLQIFDVRFQGERVAYELSLQEVVVFYGGYGPTQSASSHYFASMGLGSSSFELVRGVDCPGTATFLDAHHFINSQEPRYYKNVVCIFENNPGIPLRRHYANNLRGGYTSYGGLVDYHLVVRTIASIRNYDYVFDYMFHLNGAIESKISPTGYVQATFGLPHETLYGYPIHRDVVSDVCLHLFHFKVDLDIGGEKNRYSVMEMTVETTSHPWYHTQNKTQLRFNKIEIDSENDVSQQEYSGTEYHVIYNAFATNKYHVNRGYRIQNSNKVDFQPLENVNVTSAARWAKYPIAVTKAKEWEELSTSLYAQNEPYNPIVDFERFLSDNDSIVDEDLVTWLTLGHFHIPRTEDVPSTTVTGGQLQFSLLPFNFFEECPSVSSANVVKIVPLGHEQVNVNTFGTSFESACTQDSDGPFGYDGRYLPDDNDG